MSNILRLHGAMLVAITIVLLTPIVTIAQDDSDSDTREVMSYQLTEQGLASYMQASRNLVPLANELSGDCDDDEDTQSLDDVVARFDEIAGVREAIESAGITTREYIVFSWSLLHTGLASWSINQPGGSLPEGASMANVNFYREHETEIKKLASQNKAADCEAGDVSDEDEFN